MDSFRLEKTDRAAIPWVMLGGIAVFGIALWSIALAVLVGLLWVLPIIISANVGQKKNRGGAWWGFLLGWLGVAIVCCLGRVPTRDELELERLQRELQVRALQRQLSEAS